MNYDKVAAAMPTQYKYWHEVNIMNKEIQASASEKFKFTIVICLAARTKTLSDKLEGFMCNTEKTENVEINMGQSSK